MRFGDFALHSTRELPREQQFDFWQSLFMYVGLEPLEPWHEDLPYDAEAFTGQAANGIAFGTSRSSDTRAQFGHTDQDDIVVSLTLSGSATVLDKSGNARNVDQESGLVLIDMARSSSIVTQGEHKHVFLSIPRDLLVSECAQDPFGSLPAIGLPSSSALELILSANLRMIDEQALRMSVKDADLVISQAADLALYCLSASDEVTESRADRISYLAACDHIDRHLGNPDLTSESIAAALGFSRAHLYRLFASRGETVAGSLRDRRLDRARYLFDQGRASNLEVIAFAVGYNSAAAFGRAFKKRFGLAPRDYRAILVDRQV